MATRDGHQWMLSSPVFGEAFAPERVDADKGIIYGMAVVTEGEAKGHGVHLDAEFVEEVVRRGNQKASGLKSRFGHPTMSSTALGTFLGRVKNLRIDRSGGPAIARGDLFLSTTAKETPQGDLYGYVLSLADADDKAFGNSIVFEPGTQYQRDEHGNKVTPKQNGQPVFVELLDLHASDLVDDPAANPDGLFASPWATGTWAGQVAEFLDTHPQVFGLIEHHPEVVKGFMARYRSYLERKGKPMAEDVQAAVEAVEQTPDVPEETTVAADAATDTEQLAAPPAEPPAADPPADKPGKRFLDAFGAQGAVWFVEGKTFEEAMDLHVADLKSQLEMANAALADAIADKEKALADAKAEHEKALAAKDAELKALAERLSAAAAAGLGNPPVAVTPAIEGEDEEYQRLLKSFGGDETKARRAFRNRQKAREADAAKG